jgi:multidrug efflux pump subunit AcrA (membrane-fusion protein)
VQGNSSTTLGFEVNGRIKQVFKHIGDSVTPGEAIAQIDDQQLRLDVQKAQNSLTQSELSYSKNMNPLSSAQREQLAKDLEIGELSHDQQVLKLQNDIISNEQSITTAKQKLAQLEDNLNDL